MDVSREQNRWMDIGWYKRETEGRKGGKKEGRKEEGRKEERMSIHQYSKCPGYTEHFK